MKKSTLLSAAIVIGALAAAAIPAMAGSGSAPKSYPGSPVEGPWSRQTGAADNAGKSKSYAGSPVEGPWSRQTGAADNAGKSKSYTGSPVEGSWSRNL